MDEEIIEILFKKREENIFISKEQEKEILGEETTKISNITKLIFDNNIISQLLKYEEQCNTLNGEYLKRFYKQRFLWCYENIKIKSKKKIVVNYYFFCLGGD